MCHFCPLGKSCSLKFNIQNFNSTQPLDLLHLDVWGPSPVISNSGFRYYLSIVNNFSCYVWVFPLIHKFDVFQMFAQFKTQIENQLSRKIFAIYTIKTIQTDGGGECVNRQFSNFLILHGIKH